MSKARSTAVAKQPKSVSARTTSRAPSSPVRCASFHYLDGRFTRLLTLLAVSWISLCCTKPETTNEELGRVEQKTAKPGAESRVGKSYGQPLSARKKTPLADVLAEPDKFEGKTVLVDGHVRRACSRKGCWMEISTEAREDAPGCRVTFQDYAFFVPKDSQGKHATVEATVNLSRVKPSHVEHLESEGGTFRKKNPDGSADEVQLTASGVVLAES